MSLILLTFIVGLVNLGLGYALAVRMGYGPSTLADAWAAVAALGRERLETERAVDELFEELVSEPGREPTELPSAAGQSAAPGEAPAEPFLEGAVLALKREFLENEARLVGIDSALRCTTGPTEKTIEAQARALAESCESYLAGLGKASERFPARFHELEAIQPLGEQIDVALAEQSTQLDAALRNLRQMDLTSDPEAAAGQLREEIVTLLGTMHRLRDFLDTAYVAVARHADRFDTLEESHCTDPMTNLPNRIGLERILRDWWQQGRHQTSRNCAVLFDLNGFARLNRDRGPSVGNQILRAVAERMRGCLGPDDLIVRYSGQRILVLLSGVEADEARQTAEQICQTVAGEAFAEGEAAIQVSVSGGAVEILSHDAPQDVLDRLEQALAQAKTAGHGPVLFLDGDAAARYSSVTSLS